MPTKPTNLDWIKAIVADPPEGCAIFPGNKSTHGYAKIKVDGTMYRAHRYAYILANGPVPDGLIVLHSCVRTRACCNPRHLRAGTHADNMADYLRERARELELNPPPPKPPKPPPVRQPRPPRPPRPPKPPKPLKPPRRARATMLSLRVPPDLAIPLAGAVEQEGKGRTETLLRYIRAGLKADGLLPPIPERKP